MRRILHTERGNALLSWIAVGVALLAVASSVRLGEVDWTVFGIGLVAVLLAPAAASGSPRTMPPWAVALFAAAAFAVGVADPGSPVDEFVGYAAIAAVAILVVVEIDVFTPVEMNRGFGIALVVLTTVTAAGAWELCLWLWDLATGTELVESNDAVMRRLIAATGAGIVAGIAFDWYLRRLPRAELVPDGFDPDDASDQVDSAGEAVSGVLTRVGISTERQHRTVRWLQLVLAALVGVGIVTLEVDLVVNAGIGLGATLVPAALERDTSLEPDAGLTLWIAVAVVLHSLGTFALYQTVWGWHNLAHAVSGTLVAGIGYTTVRALEDHTEAVSFPPKFTFVFVVLFVFSVGVFWEILEFTLDRLSAAFGTEGMVLAQHGLEDTMSDLVANTAGALLVASAATVYRRREVERHYREEDSEPTGATDE